MLSKRVLPLTAALVLFLAAALSAQPTLTNDDVVKMAKAGLSPKTIEEIISASVPAFQVDADSVIALAREGVAEPVIQAMIRKQRQAVTTNPAASRPASAAVGQAAPAAPKTSVSPARRRFDVSIHRSKHARCSRGELILTAGGMKAGGCHESNFEVAWKNIESLCIDGSFRSTLSIRTGTKSYRISAITPAELKGITESIRRFAPRLRATDCTE